jgi:hypothetical protein
MSHSSFAEFPDLLRCDAVSLGEGCCELEAWSLTLIDKNGLMIFEDRVLRGIFDIRMRK